MSTYLEEFLEEISSLPSEVQRNFLLMRELDEKSQDYPTVLEEETASIGWPSPRPRVRRRPVRILMSKRTLDLVQHVDNLHRNFLRRPDKVTEKAEETLKRIREAQDKALAHCDEKIAISQQTYNLLDTHIRRLDEDLGKLEQDILKEQRRPAGGNRKALRKTVPNAPTGFMGVKPIDNDLPVDPNEPVYCTCNRVSFGQMVCCDNPHCKYEWFHYQCVGLTETPKGEWLCPECRMLKKRGLGGSRR